MTKNFKKEILEKIKEGKIDQKSKWYFLTKSYVFWFFSGFATILGGFAFATILFQVQENNRAFLLPPKAGKMAEGFWEAIPHWWLLVFVGLLVIAYVNYKNTYKSYKKENIIIIILSLMISFILGFIIFFTGIAKNIDHKARGVFPRYDEHIKERRDRINYFLKKEGYEMRDLKDFELRKKIREEIKNRFENRKL